MKQRKTPGTSSIVSVASARGSRASSALDPSFMRGESMDYEYSFGSYPATHTSRRCGRFREVYSWRALQEGIDFRGPQARRAFLQYREDYAFNLSRGAIARYAFISTGALWGAAIYALAYLQAWASDRRGNLDSIADRKAGTNWTIKHLDPQAKENETWMVYYPYLTLVAAVLNTVLFILLLWFLYRQSRRSAHQGKFARRLWMRFVPVYFMLTAMCITLTAVAVIDIYAEGLSRQLVEQVSTPATVAAKKASMGHASLNIICCVNRSADVGTSLCSCQDQKYLDMTVREFGVPGNLTLCPDSRCYGPPTWDNKSVPWTISTAARYQVTRTFYLLTVLALLMVNMLCATILIGMRNGFYEMVWFFSGSLIYVIIYVATIKVGIWGFSPFYYVMTFGAFFLEAFIYVGMAWTVQHDFKFEFLKFYSVAEKYLNMRRPKIVAELLQITEQSLGQGGAGKVYRATYSGVSVAVKELYATIMDETDLDDFRQEAANLVNLRHPNIVQFFGVCDIGPKHLIVTEYAEGGSLRGLVEHGREIIDGNRALLFAREVIGLQIASGMTYLHGTGMKHLDIKPDNVLLKRPLDHQGATINDVHIQLCDFGLARTQDEDLTDTFAMSALEEDLKVGHAASSGFAGVSPIYAPPEVLRQEYDERLEEEYGSEFLLSLDARGGEEAAGGADEDKLRSVLPARDGERTHTLTTATSAPVMRVHSPSQVGDAEATPQASSADIGGEHVPEQIHIGAPKATLRVTSSYATPTTATAGPANGSGRWSAGLHAQTSVASFAEQKNRLFFGWDIYSYGVLMFEIYANEGFMEALKVTKRGHGGTLELVHKIVTGVRPETPTTCPAVMDEIIRLSWNRHPDARLPFKEIYEKIQTFLETSSHGQTTAVAQASQPKMEMAKLPPLSAEERVAAPRTGAATTLMLSKQASLDGGSRIRHGSKGRDRDGLSGGGGARRSRLRQMSGSHGADMSNGDRKTGGSRRGILGLPRKLAPSTSFTAIRTAFGVSDGSKTGSTVMVNPIRRGRDDGGGSKEESKTSVSGGGAPPQTLQRGAPAERHRTLPKDTQQQPQQHHKGSAAATPPSSREEKTTGESLRAASPTSSKRVSQRHHTSATRPQLASSVTSATKRDASSSL